MTEDTARPSSKPEAATARASATAVPSAKRERGFLGVFVVRSFRESHLDGAIKILDSEVEGFSSRYWGDKPYYLINTESTLVGGSFLLEEIARQIANAAITIVILDGLRLNVLFELGLLYGLNRPFVVLRHKRWGPPFGELDSLASDLKGVVIKNFDHEYEEQRFRELIRAELARCDEEFVDRLGGHLIVPSKTANLTGNDHWTFESAEQGSREDNKIVLRSFHFAELKVVQRVSPRSLFVLGFELQDVKAAVTAYLHVRLRRDGREVGLWVGYTSGTLTGRHEPAEITIPITVSGPGEFTLFDNIQKMVAQRLGLSVVDKLLVDVIRLRGHDGSSTTFTHVRLTD